MRIVLILLFFARTCVVAADRGGGNPGKGGGGHDSSSSSTSSTTNSLSNASAATSVAVATTTATEPVVTSEPISSPHTGTPTTPFSSSTPSSSLSSSSTSSAPGSNPSTGSIQILSPGNTTTCEAMPVAWNVSGDLQVALTVIVTNEGVTIGQKAPATVISHTLSSNVSSSTRLVVWNPVDVPEGWYIFVINDSSSAPAMSSQSRPFFVQDGDESCLGGATPSRPSGSSSSVAPADDAATGHLSKGDMIGTIVGIIIGVFLLVSFFVFPRAFKRIRAARAAHQQMRRPGGPYYLF